MDNREWNISYNHCRVRRVLNFLSGEDSADEVFMIPKQKITVEIVKSILRDHYGELSPYHHKNPETYSDRPIAVFRTSFSHINQHRKGLPSDIGSVDYISYGFSDISIYMPFYKGLGDNFPRAYQTTTSKIDDDSIFWMLRKLQTLVMQNYPKIAPGVKKAIYDFEEQIREKQTKMEDEYLAYFNKGDMSSAKKCIVDYTTQWVDDEVKFLKKQIKECNCEYKFDNEAFFKKAVEVEKRHHFGADVPPDVTATLRFDDVYTNPF